MPNSPIGQAHRFPINRQQTIASGVARLLSSAGPSAIIWSIALIVVDAIELRAVRLRTHVCDEGYKVLPSVTDSDSTPAVITEVPVSGVTTAIVHLNPNLVLRRTTTIACSAVFPGRSVPEASTAPRVTASEIRAVDERVGTALATAVPDNEPACASSFISRTQDRQQPKDVPGQIVSCARLLRSHAVSAYVGDGVVRGWRALMTFASLANYPTLVAV